MNILILVLLVVNLLLTVWNMVHINEIHFWVLKLVDHFQHQINKDGE